MRAEEWPLVLVTCSSLVILTRGFSDVTGRMSRVEVQKESRRQWCKRKKISSTNLVMKEMGVVADEIIVVKKVHFI